MKDSEKLDLILNMVTTLDNKVTMLDNKVTILDNRVATLEKDMVEVKEDLKRLHSDDVLILDEVVRVHEILLSHMKDTTKHTA